MSDLFKTAKECMAFVEMHTGNGTRWAFSPDVCSGEHAEPDPELIRAKAEAALAEMAAILTAPRCVYPDCCNTRRTRGLCHQHYQTMRSYVRDGKATETDLEARGLLLGKGTGGSPVSDHSAFLLGSDVRGEQ